MSGVQSKNEAQYFNHVLKSQMEWNMFITSDGWSNGCLTYKCQCHVANEMESSFLRRTEKHIYCGRMGIWDAFNTSYNNIWYLTKIDVLLFYLEIGNHFEYWKPGLSTLSIGRIDPHFFAHQEINGLTSLLNPIFTILRNSHSICFCSGFSPISIFQSSNVSINPWSTLFLFQGISSFAIQS